MAKSKLPFESLPINNDHYLIDNFLINYLSTGRDVLEFNKITGKTSETVVAADPDFNFAIGKLFNESDHMHFEPMEETRIEAENIGKLLHIRPWLVPIFQRTDLGIINHRLYYV
jgi:hypothetical protein